MAKTQKELEALKEEYDALKAKLAELSEDELKHVKGGYGKHDNVRCEIADNCPFSSPCADSADNWNCKYHTK